MQRGPATNCNISISAPILDDVSFRTVVLGRRIFMIQWIYSERLKSLPMSLSAARNEKPGETSSASVAACHEDTSAITTTTIADLSMEENATSVYRSPIAPSADTEDGPSATMLEVKGGHVDKPVPKEEVSREIAGRVDVDVGVEVAAVADEDELDTAGEWYDGTM